MKPIHLLVVLSSVVSCTSVQPVPPRAGSFSLEAPSSAVLQPGGSVDVTVRFLRDSLDGPIVLSTSTAPAGVSVIVTPSPVTGDSATLSITAAPTAQAGTLTLSATAGTVERTAAMELTLAKTFQSPTKASPLTVRLNKLFYGEGDAITAVVDFGTLTAPATLPQLIIASGDSKDAEALTLVRGSDNTWTTEGTLTVKAGSSVPGDGVMQLSPGNSFFAFYAVDRSQPSLATVEASLISDFAFFDGPADPASPGTIDARFALNAEEATSPIPVGTVVRRGFLPVQLASNQLILTAGSQAEVTRFLAATMGRVLDDLPASEDGTVRTWLIEVNASALMTAERTSRLRAFLGETGELATSTAAANAIYGLTLALRLDGFQVSVNPRLQGDAAPVTTDPNVSRNMQASGVAGSTTCVPNSTTNPCVRSAPAVWNYLALLDRDTRRVSFGVLDYGFATNDDFRRNTDGGIRECDLTVRPARCGTAAAQGRPTVRSSGVGGFVWHGTSTVTGIGGVVNNGFGGVGVGGQVGVPMLYKYDTMGFVFDMGRGIRQAVDDGASVINISAGYPCGVVTTVGPDLDICTTEGRLAICAVVTAAATAAAIAFCSSPLVGIPIAGAIACGALTTAAITATGACVTALGFNLALGNPSGPMRASLQHARSRGVPVVVSAGNVLSRDSLPEVIRDYVDLSERRTERWNVVPANLPEPITVGAVNEALDNEEFFGSRVDVWAPIYTAYLSPSSETDPSSPLAPGRASGTSAAAPYVAGTIVAMQAVNPELDPRTPGLTSAQLRANVERIRGLLRSTAWTNTQLVGLGHTNQPEERRNLINPLGAVQAAAMGQLPDLAALGYDTSLNFDDDGSDDLPAGARSLIPAGVAGTILTWAPATVADRDWYRVPGSDGTTMIAQEFTVRWSTEGIEAPVFVFDRTSEFVQQLSITSSGAERVGTFRFLTRAVDALFAVTAPVGSDFPYRLTLGSRSTPSVTVTITDPIVSAGDEFCVNERISLNATAFYTGTSLPEPRITWRAGGVLLGTGILAAATFPSVGTRVVTATAGGASASVTIPVVACTVSVRITTPLASISRYPMGSDPYLRLTLTGEVRDANGNLLPTAGYTFEWMTNRADVQPGGPTTGSQIVATGATTQGDFYSAPGQVSTEHRLTLVVKQGGVIVGTSPVRLINVLELI